MSACARCAAPTRRSSSGLDLPGRQKRVHRPHRRAGRAQDVDPLDDFSPVEENRISRCRAGPTRRWRAGTSSNRGAWPSRSSSTQHDILLMRELERLSSNSIGKRMGLTRGEVESLLFRARRRLRTVSKRSHRRTLRTMRAAIHGIVDGSAERATAAVSRTIASTASHAVAMPSPWGSTPWCSASTRAARAGPAPCGALPAVARVPAPQAGGGGPPGRPRRPGSSRAPRCGQGHRDPGRRRS